jgi:hypothetical protein
MNIYLYEDENYDKYYENLVISNLKYVYEITKLTNKNDTIHINKIFDTNIIIKFNDISLCNNNENICIINIIYKTDLFLTMYKTESTRVKCLLWNGLFLIGSKENIK